MVKRKLNKYDYQFIRMMVKMSLTIVGILIVMVLIGIPLLACKIILTALLVLSVVIKEVYWKYLERLEAVDVEMLE